MTTEQFKEFALQHPTAAMIEAWASPEVQQKIREAGKREGMRLDYEAIKSMCPEYTATFEEYLEQSHCSSVGRAPE